MNRLSWPGWSPDRRRPVWCQSGRSLLGGALTRNLLEGGYAGEVHLINPGIANPRPGLPPQPGRHRRSHRSRLDCHPRRWRRRNRRAMRQEAHRHAVVHSAGFAEAGEFGALVQTNLMETARRCGSGSWAPGPGIHPPLPGAQRHPVLSPHPGGQSGLRLPVRRRLPSTSSTGPSATISPFRRSSGRAPAGTWICLKSSISRHRCQDRGHSFFISKASAPAAAFQRAMGSRPQQAGGRRQAGRTAPTAALAHTHSQATGGVDASFDAALRRGRCPGFRPSATCSTPPGRWPARGGRQAIVLAIVANGGGPALLAADAAVQQGLQLARFIPATKAKAGDGTADFLVPGQSGGCPDRCQRGALCDRHRALPCRPGRGWRFAVVAPNGLSDPEDTARRILDVQREAGKPIPVSLMGESSVAESRALLTRAGVPAFRPRKAPSPLTPSWLNSSGNQGTPCSKLPASISHRKAPAAPAAKVVIDFAIQAGRETLTEGVRSAASPKPSICRCFLGGFSRRPDGSAVGRIDWNRIRSGDRSQPGTMARPCRAASPPAPCRPS